MALDAIESMASVPNPTDNFDEVYIAVRRSNGLMIERMAPRYITSTDANGDIVAILEDQIRVDSAVTYNASGTIRTGLSHLDGELVSILADGVSLTAATVADGSITTSSSTKCVVGLPIVSTIETLDMNFVERNGVSQGLQIKTANVVFKLLETRGGYIGPDEDSLYEAFSNLTVSHNASELDLIPEDYTWSGQSLTAPDPYLFSGDIRKPLGAGYGKGGRILLRQLHPYPITVTSIVPEISPGGPT